MQRFLSAFSYSRAYCNELGYLLRRVFRHRFPMRAGLLSSSFSRGRLTIFDYFLSTAVPQHWETVPPFCSALVLKHVSESIVSFELNLVYFSNIRDDRYAHHHGLSHFFVSVFAILYLVPNFAYLYILTNTHTNIHTHTHVIVSQQNGKISSKQRICSGQRRGLLRTDLVPRTTDR